MIAGLDSSYSIPTDAQLAQAAAAGVELWAGYLPEPGLANGWAASDFARVRAAGLSTLAYCSGQADPITAKLMGWSWKVPICLDVEGSIRADGAWVQAWLDASGAGLYGNAPVHAGRHAAFHILAGYPGYDPGRTWDGVPPEPNAMCGWQWRGGHTEFGAGVDRGWYDDTFALALQITPELPPRMMLLWSDPAGHPSTTGPTKYGHFVVVADTPPPVVPQMTSGFAFANEACADADIMCIGKMYGFSWTPDQIEGYTHTTGEGTTTKEVIDAFAALGINGIVIAGTPAPGFIMTSAWGADLDPSQFPLYAAASQQWYFQCTDPLPTGSTVEDEMPEVLKVPRKDGSGVEDWFVVFPEDAIGTRRGAHIPYNTVTHEIGFDDKLDGSWLVFFDGWWENLAPSVPAQLGGSGGGPLPMVVDPSASIPPTAPAPSPPAPVVPTLTVLGWGWYKGLGLSGDIFKVVWQPSTGFQTPAHVVSLH